MYGPLLRTVHRHDVLPVDVILLGPCGGKDCRCSQLADRKSHTADSTVLCYAFHVSRC